MLGRCQWEYIAKCSPTRRPVGNTVAPIMLGDSQPESGSSFVIGLTADKRSCFDFRRSGREGWTILFSGVLSVVTWGLGELSQFG